MLIERPPVASNTPLAFRTLGYDWVQHRVDHRARGLTQFFWLQTLDGYGTVQIDHHTFTLAPNQALLIKPGCNHAYQPADTGWHTAFISFAGTQAAALMPPTDADYLFFPSLSGELAQFLRLHLDAFTCDTPAARLDQATALFRFLLLLHDQADADTGFYGETLLEPIITYIASHYDQPITNADLCRLTGYSAPYQTKLFRRHYGVTPLQYLNAYRLCTAKKLLALHPDWQIQAVACATGFSDISRFIHDFKGLTGYTPLQYRKDDQCG